MPPQVFIRVAEIHPIDILTGLAPCGRSVQSLVLHGKPHPGPNHGAEFTSKASLHDHASSVITVLMAASRPHLISLRSSQAAGRKGYVNFLTVPLLLRPHWSK